MRHRACVHPDLFQKNADSSRRLNRGRAPPCLTYVRGIVRCLHCRFCARRSSLSSACDGCACLLVVTSYWTGCDCYRHTFFFMPFFEHGLNILDLYFFIFDVRKKDVLVSFQLNFKRKFKRFSK